MPNDVHGTAQAAPLYGPVMDLQTSGVQSNLRLSPERRYDREHAVVEALGTSFS